MSFKKLSSILLVLFFSSSAFTINTIEEGWRTQNATIEVRNAENTCFKISGPDYFIPTRTTQEWLAFVAAAPRLGVNVVACTVYVYSWRTGNYGAIEPLNLIGHLEWRPNIAFWCSKEDPNIAAWPARSVGAVDDSLCPQPKPVERCIWTAYPANDVIKEECH